MVVRSGSDGRPVAMRPWSADSGVLVAAGFVAVVAGGLVAALVPGHLTGLRVAVLAVVVGAFCVAAADAVAALATAGTAWLCCNGFLIDQFGVLRWHGWADLARLAVLAAAAAVGVVVGLLVRLVGRARRDLRASGAGGEQAADGTARSGPGAGRATGVRTKSA